MRHTGDTLAPIIDRAIARIKVSEGLRSDADVARLLGITPARLSSARYGVGRPTVLRVLREGAATPAELAEARYLLKLDGWPAGGAA